MKNCSFCNHTVIIKTFQHEEETLMRVWLNLNGQPPDLHRPTLKRVLWLTVACRGVDVKHKHTTSNISE